MNLSFFVYFYIIVFSFCTNFQLQSSYDHFSKSFTNPTSKHLMITSHDGRRLNGYDDIILACLTFPAHRNSKRLNQLFGELESLGTVSLENYEEQTCDSLRLRLRLFVRRVVSLVSQLNKKKNEMEKFIYLKNNNN